ncbi:hypothetical protein EGT07_15845 [Herbaspirillum sp. HC18]|nr:hypothetical protein EGT07_15845 [Herbaspirillum sp. HC18]
MSKTVLFFSCEPGGAEVLIPVIEWFSGQPDYEVVTCGYGHGAARFADKAIPHVAIEPIAKEDNRLLIHSKPDLVITSAASLPERDMSEKHLWLQARDAGVPSIAFLDQWQNYAIRFSGPCNTERLAYLPDYINCIDGIGRREMIAAGFEEARLVEFGHPYLSALRERALQVDRNAVRKRLDFNEAQSATLFVSEAIREHYGQARGYDQYDALSLFFAMMERTPERSRPLIKLHPKDELQAYEALLNRYASLDPVVIRNELNSVECIEVADAVFGMTSVMLIEAFVLGKPVVSLQPGLIGADPMVLSRIGCIPRIVVADAAYSACGLPRSSAAGTDFDYVFREQAFLEFTAALLDA